MKTSSKLSKWDIIKPCEREYHSIARLAKKYSCSTSAVKRMIYKNKKAYDAFLTHAPDPKILNPFEIPDNN
jgi:Mor family transcriptional regulator